MDKKTLTEKLEEAKKNSKKRKFKQTIEICINFKDVNLDSTDKINTSIKLPKGRGRKTEIGVFADGDLNLQAKKHSKHVLNKTEIEDYSKNRAKMKKTANSCYSFIAQPDLMPTIGKNWGIILAPRGKMPAPIPPNTDIKKYIENIRDTVKIRTKKNPTIHVPVGTEDMSTEDLIENINAVMKEIQRTINEEQIAAIYCKTTMGPAVKITE